MTKMPPAGYPAFLQYLQSGRVRIVQAKQWAEILGKRVILWVSDKQDAFVTGIAAEFPEVPHRYCDNHFLRDAAKPVLDADSRPRKCGRRCVA